MRALVLMLTFLVLAVGAEAAAQQQSSEAPVCSDSQLAKPPDEIVPVIPPTARMTTKIAFVIDSSGSMDCGGRISMAITFAMNILGQGCDELQVAIFAFRETFVRWPGVPHEGDGKPPPKGWTCFPGVKQLNSAQSWLMNNGATGCTDPNGAMEAALAEDIANLTVVLISDGEFNGDLFKEAVAKGQSLREKKGLGKAVIIIVGIGEDSMKQEHMKEVGKKEGGGFYIVKRPGEPRGPF